MTGVVQPMSSQLPNASWCHPDPNTRLSCSTSQKCLSSTSPVGSHPRGFTHTPSSVAMKDPTAPLSRPLSPVLPSSIPSVRSLPVACALCSRLQLPGVYRSSGRRSLITGELGVRSRIETRCRWQFPSNCCRTATLRASKGAFGTSVSTSTGSRACPQLVALWRRDGTTTMPSVPTALWATEHSEKSHTRGVGLRRLDSRPRGHNPGSRSLLVY